MDNKHFTYVDGIITDIMKIMDELMGVKIDNNTKEVFKHKCEEVFRKHGIQIDEDHDGDMYNCDFYLCKRMNSETGDVEEFVTCVEKGKEPLFIADSKFDKLVYSIKISESKARELTGIGE